MKGRPSKREREWRKKQKPIPFEDIRQGVYAGQFIARPLISPRVMEKEPGFSAKFNRLGKWRWFTNGDFTAVVVDLDSQDLSLVGCSKRKADDAGNEKIGLQTALVRAIRAIPLDTPSNPVVE